MENIITKNITTDPLICHGKPIIKGTRMMVVSVLEYLAAGDSVEDLLDEFPYLSKEQVQACLAYATEMMRFNDQFLKAS